jgi:hypothetical protein
MESKLEALVPFLGASKTVSGEVQEPSILDKRARLACAPVSHPLPKKIALTVALGKQELSRDAERGKKKSERIAIASQLWS